MSLIHTWRSLFEQAELTAQESAQAARKLLISCHDRSPGSLPKPLGLLRSLEAQPEWTLERLLGPDTSPIPLVDPVSRQVSEMGCIDLLERTGLEPEVRAAYAKVLALMYRPSDFYQPVWQGLERDGPLDMAELAELDWTPALPPLHGQTEIAVAASSARQKP